MPCNYKHRFVNLISGYICHSSPLKLIKAQGDSGQQVEYSNSKALLQTLLFPLCCFADHNPQQQGQNTSTHRAVQTAPLVPAAGASSSASLEQSTTLAGAIADLEALQQSA